jgi:hypothetical protein
MGRRAKIITIKERLSVLKQLHRGSASHLRPRIQLLILIKTGKAFSKQSLADALGVDPNSAQSWKMRYEQGGMELLLGDKRGGFKKPIIDEVTDKAIQLRLSNPKEAPRSFKELQQWVNDNYIPGINYQTLNKHVKRKYGAKIKVARKSHVQKDEQAVEAFKKNWVIGR